MQAVTFQAPGEVRVEECPDPALGAADDAIVRVEASGICGSDLHLYHGRIPLEAGFILGHEFVGTVTAAGPVLAMMTAGLLDPTPLVSRHAPLADAPEAYAAYARREALKIVLTP